VPGPDGRPKRAIARQNMIRLQVELTALTDPAANGPVALGIRDAKVVGDTEIRVRGEAEKLGPVVSRGYLSAVPVADAPQVNANQSGRLELAQWLTSERNPLTSRVIVNRVWQHLFGQGLVRSVDNFGSTGDVPSHAELLDFLAVRFVRNGWSIKRLVRELVLSNSYQLASDAATANLSVDPANRFIWRHSPRRLDAEEIRDAILAAAGKLDRARPQASVAKDMKVVEISDDGAEARRVAREAFVSVHRSVYLPLLRGLTPRALEVFDFADQGMVSGSRDSTTVAPQALYLLNDPFVRRQSLALAERSLEHTVLDEGSRVNRVYRLTLGREATLPEIERAKGYLAEYAAAAREAMQLAKVSKPGRPADTGPGPEANQDAAASKKRPKTPTGKQANADPGPESIKDDPPPSDPRVASWASLCQALLGSAEFRYVR
jgi:hypothetical protein